MSAPFRFPKFFVTNPAPCPYLEGRAERKLFTALQGEGAEKLNNALSRQGFRRSQNVLYRPSCADCAACLSARIRVADFTPSRSQRRVLNRNAALKRAATSPWATEDQFTLFRRYLDHRHADALRLAGPWGQGFPEPLFDGHFEVANWRVLKERHLKLELRLPGVPGTINAIHFGGWHGNAPGKHVHLAYRLACDDYRGGAAIQLIVEHCLPA